MTSSHTSDVTNINFVDKYLQTIIRVHHYFLSSCCHHFLACTQPSTLHAIVKWVSDFGLSNNNNDLVVLYHFCVIKVVHKCLNVEKHDTWYLCIGLTAKCCPILQILSLMDSLIILPRDTSDISPPIATACRYNTILKWAIIPERCEPVSSSTFFIITSTLCTLFLCLQLQL